MNDIPEAQIVEAEERLRAAMLRGDLGVIDGLIAPELLFTNQFGQIVSKAADLAVFQSGVLQLQELAPSEQQIQLHADFAVVSVRMHLRGSYAGTPIDESIRYTRVWSAAPDGTLWVIAGHASTVLAG